MAYTKENCYPGCPARITDIGKKMVLLETLIFSAQSKKEKRKLAEELEDAKRVSRVIREGKFDGWMSCYWTDTHRGEKGGASEGDSSNRAKGMKQLMKDNRPVDVKPNKAQQVEYKEALTKWEEENGKLEKLSRSSMGHSREDSYTGIPVCFLDSGLGTCKGVRSSIGSLSPQCKECKFLRK